jgi:hypothetical protein
MTISKCSGVNRRTGTNVDDFDHGPGEELPRFVTWYVREHG